MIADAHLDRILGDWLADGPERAPAFHIQAALDEVATVDQRRTPALTRRLVGSTADPRPDRRLLLALAAVLVLAAAAALGAAAGLFDRTAPPLEPVPSLESREFQEQAVSVPLPTGWSLLEERCCELVRFIGPDGHSSMAVNHDAPHFGVVCGPECETIEIPFFLPYSVTKQLDAFAAEISVLTGGDGWVTLRPDQVPAIEQPRRLDVTAMDAGVETRQVFVIGVHLQRLVAVSWVQPSATLDENLLSAVLAQLTVHQGAQYATGGLITHEDAVGGFDVLVPDLWAFPSQPEVDGSPAVGVRDFFEGSLVVSVGEADGTIVLCELACRSATGVTSIGELEAALSQGITATVAIETTGQTTLGGHPARFQRVTRTSPDQTITRLYRVFAMHDGRPTVLTFDITAGTTDQSVLDEIVASFEFHGPPPGVAMTTFTGPDGSFEVTLPDVWSITNGSDEETLYLARGAQELMIRRGADDGRIVTCDASAAPFETCEDVRPRSLLELAEAVEPEPISEEGIGPPIVVVGSETLDGEPATTYEIVAYEHPARGSQAVVYIVAFHDDRPYIIRIWTPNETGIVDLQAVLQEFRFLDPAS